MSKPRKLKVGVRVGGGPPPGYEWNVLAFDRAVAEAMSFLTKAQYTHMVMQVKELAREAQPTACATVDIDSIENIYEIRDKGGPLGGLNVRVFFGIDHVSRSIVVLGAIVKQNNGKTPYGDKQRMLRRWDKYSEFKMDLPELDQ